MGHLLKQCVSLINASRLRCLFLHSNVLFTVHLIGGGGGMLLGSSIFKNCKQGGYTFVGIIPTVL